MVWTVVMIILLMTTVKRAVNLLLIVPLLSFPVSLHLFIFFFLFSLSPFKPPVVTVDCLQDMSKTKYLVHRGHVLGLPHAYIIKTHRNAGNDCSSLQYKSIYLFQQPSQHTHLPVFGLRLSLCCTMCTYCMSFNP